MTDINEHEKEQKFQQICDSLGLGEVLSCYSLSIIASCNELFRLHTICGWYGFKSYALEKKNQLLSSRKIKKIFTDEENYFYEDKNVVWIIFSWREGHVLSFQEIKFLHIQKIAKIIGKMHKMNITLPDALPVYDYDFHPKLKENLIISHGDIIPQNVVWEKNNNPILIDWENAGWINQDLELFNAAINWAGIESGKLNNDHYEQFIKSYREEYPRVIQIDAELVRASLGSWLKWWEETKDPRTPKVLEILTSTRFW